MEHIQSENNRSKLKTQWSKHNRSEHGRSKHKRSEQWRNFKFWAPLQDFQNPPTATNNLTDNILKIIN